jgi:hypothetical protein
MTGFFKKLKDTAEKGLEKGTEIGTKGFDAAKETAKKGIEKAREEKNSEDMIPEPIQEKEIPKNETNNPEPLVENSEKQTTSQSSDKPLKLLKLRFAKGEISKEEYEEMKKLVE